MNWGGQSQSEAALIIAVPKLESVVHPFRSIYDPSAAEGMPAHITINYPFLPGKNPSEWVLRNLAELFAKSTSFDFALTQFARFPGVLYLSPDPVGPFKELIEKVVIQFPESPPYGGAFEAIVPHLTIAHSGDDQVLDMIEREVVAIRRKVRPVNLRAEQVWLMKKEEGGWKKVKSFPLGKE